MPDINLRPPHAHEHRIIRDLIIKNNLNPLDLEPGRFTVAADDQDKLIGCGQIRKHGNLEELASLVVVDEWQGRGVSTLLMNELLARSGRPLWLMCESHLTDYYTRFGFREVSGPANLPPYFQGIYWIATFGFALVFLARGTYLAFMVLEE